MAGAVSTFKSDHHIVFGIALGAVGVFGLIGSLTGSLAVMLAALFDPSALIDGSGGGGINAPPIPAKDSTGSDEPSDDTPSTPDTPDTPDVPAGVPDPFPVVPAL